MTDANAIPLAGSESQPPVANDVRAGAWYAFAVLLGVVLFAFVDRQVLTLAAPPIAHSLKLSDSELGLVQGLAFAIFSVAAAYPIAWAADRLDRRIVLGACVLTWSAGTAACGLAENFEELFGAAVLIAAGEAGVTPIITSLVPELFTGRKRIVANGLFYIFAFVGVSAGLALGGGAIGFLGSMHANLPAPLQSFEPWRLAFFLLAAPAPILLVLLIFAPIGRRSPSKVPTIVKPDSRLLPFIRQHARAVGTVFLALSLYMLGFGGYLVWIPVAATRLFGTTPAQNGLAMGIASMMGMIGGVSLGTFAVRRLTARMGAVATVRFFWIAMIAATPVLLAFPLAISAWQIFALFGALMLSGTAIGSMVLTLLQDMAPADLRARLAAVWGVTSGLTVGSAPTLIGWTSSALGAEPRALPMAMTIVAIPCWIIAIPLLILAEQPFSRLLREVADHERRHAI